MCGCWRPVWATGGLFRLAANGDKMALLRPGWRCHQLSSSVTTFPSIAVDLRRHAQIMAFYRDRCPRSSGIWDRAPQLIAMDGKRCDVLILGGIGWRLPGGGNMN